MTLACYGALEIVRVIIIIIIIIIKALAMLACMNIRRYNQKSIGRYWKPNNQ